MAPTNSYGQEMVSIYLIKIKITTKFFKLLILKQEITTVAVALFSLVVLLSSETVSNAQWLYIFLSICSYLYQINLLSLGILVMGVLLHTLKFLAFFFSFFLNVLNQVFLCCYICVRCANIRQRKIGH